MMFIGRLRIAGLILALALLPLCAQSQSKALKIIAKTANPVLIPLEDTPRFTFTSTTAELRTDRLSLSFALADSLNLTVVDYDPAAVTTPDKPLPTVVSLGDGVEVFQASAQIPVRLYRLDGRLLRAETTDASGHAFLPLPGRGVFLLQIGTLNVKLSN